MTDKSFKITNLKKIIEIKDDSNPNAETIQVNIDANAPFYSSIITQDELDNGDIQFRENHGFLNEMVKKSKGVSHFLLLKADSVVDAMISFQGKKAQTFTPIDFNAMENFSNKTDISQTTELVQPKTSSPVSPPKNTPPPKKKIFTVTNVLLGLVIGILIGYGSYYIYNKYMNKKSKKKQKSKLSFNKSNVSEQIEQSVHSPSQIESSVHSKVVNKTVSKQGSVLPSNKELSINIKDISSLSESSTNN